MDGQLSEGEKELRNQELLAVIDDSMKRKLAADVGTEKEILVEGVSKRNDARMMGRTRQNRIVVFPGGERHQGQLMRVRIEEAIGFTLLGAPDILD